jgi:hypothetical protein
MELAGAGDFPMQLKGPVNFMWNFKGRRLSYGTSGDGDFHEELQRIVIFVWNWQGLATFLCNFSVWWL